MKQTDRQTDMRSHLKELPTAPTLVYEFVGKKWPLELLARAFCVEKRSIIPARTSYNILHEISTISTCNLPSVNSTTSVPTSYPLEMGHTDRQTDIKNFEELANSSLRC